MSPELGWKKNGQEFKEVDRPEVAFLGAHKASEFHEQTQAVLNTEKTGKAISISLLGTSAATVRQRLRNASIKAGVKLRSLTDRQHLICWVEKTKKDTK